MLPDGETEFRTVPGAILSLIALFLSVVYGGFNFVKLISRNDYDIQEQKYEHFYKTSDEYWFGLDFSQVPDD